MNGLKANKKDKQLSDANKLQVVSERRERIAGSQSLTRMQARSAAPQRSTAAPQHRSNGTAELTCMTLKRDESVNMYANMSD